MLESISIYFIPETAREIMTYIERILSNSRSADAISIGFSILMALFLVYALCKSINRIWGKKIQESVVKSLVKAVITILCAPGFIIITLYLQHYVSLRKIFFLTPLHHTLNSVVSQILSLVVNWFLLAFVFGLMPHYRVKIGYTMVAGIVCGTLWYLLRIGLNVYVTVIPQFNILYGSLAFFPILLIWIYISWLIVLFGIQLNYTFHFELK
jgi:membrane protein